MKSTAATPFLIGECVNLQFRNGNCSYLLSIINILEEQLSTFVLAGLTFGTTTFSNELLFKSTYSLNFLSGNWTFWEQQLKRIYLKHQVIVKIMYIFFKTTPGVVHSFKVVCHFIFREEKRLAIHFFDRTDFFWRITLSHPFFHGGLFFAEQLQPCILSGVIWNR